MGRHTAKPGFAVLLALAVLAAPTAAAEDRASPIRLPFEASTTDGSQVVVVRGDHLWKISGRHLRTLYGDEPDNAELSGYWRRVIEENRHSLRSGDPDLIYPGEVIKLPPVP
ncbi:MAG: LysM peptidoglycan-binding domain-containing protein [Acidimicrobiia bacterium]|nr:LysM peptidoglycan-binding domain-containing protein [Acidimicrobiia bacterium]